MIEEEISQKSSVSTHVCQNWQFTRTPSESDEKLNK